MYRRFIKVKRVHGVGKAEDTEIVIANEHLHASGVFSNVYRAQMLLPVVQSIAIKKVWLSKTTPKAAALEIDLLKRVNHPNVISLLYHFKLVTSDEVCECLVFDFLPTDVSKLRLEQPGRRFHPLDAKLYAWQMFAGLNHVHNCEITHCDLKPSNLIVDERHGLLKLADFGNAKILKKGEKLNPYQVTRYYRAPELVFGAREFTMAVDLWAAACVLAELHLGRPLLCGTDNVDQGRAIVEVLGFPTDEQIKAMRITRPKLSRKKARGFGHLLANTTFPSLAHDILKRTLVYDPSIRISIEDILAHAYFDELRLNPPPKRSNGTPIPPLNYWALEQKTQPDRSTKIPTMQVDQEYETAKTDASQTIPQSSVLKRWWFW